MSSHFKLTDVTIHRRGPKCYHFGFYASRAEINELLDWAEALPNQGQYQALLEINVISDMPPSPICYYVTANIWGKELAGPFLQRWKP